MLGMWLVCLVWVWLTSLVAAYDYFGLNETDSVYKWDWNKSSQDISSDLDTYLALATTAIIDKSIDGGSGENGTFLVLCRNNEIYELLETIQSVEDRYNYRHHHDWVFLNDEPFSARLVHMVSLHIPYGKLSFGQVPTEHWLYPPWINQTLAREKRQELAEKDVVYAESESYRHMCRFFLGFFYKHPLVAQYQYYWRVEPGVRFYCNIEYDVFAFMRENAKKYAFVLSMFEYSDTITSLWSTVQTFLENHVLPEDNFLEFVQNDNREKSYNLCHFWLNFEIGDLSFFNSPQYQQYFEHLDTSGGFFYERWGDAPIHTLAVSMFLLKNDIWWFGDMGYYHLPYLHCPQDDTLFVGNRCACDQNMDFTTSYLSCTPHFLRLLTGA